jgi:hypothetical protein
MRLCDVTLVIIPIRTYSLMARCLKGECSPEEHRIFTDLLSTNHDLKQGYEIFQDYFDHHNSEKHHAGTEPGLQKKFDGITKKLMEDGILEPAEPPLKKSEIAPTEEYSPPTVHELVLKSHRGKHSILRKN